MTVPGLHKSGIARRWGRAIAVQAALVAVSALLGVWVASWVIQEVLVKEALRTEAEHFWQRRAVTPDFPPPNTRNLMGYLNLPLPLGFLDLNNTASQDFPDTPIDYSIAYVSEKNGERLVLVFDGEQVRELTFFFGLAPLAVVLILIYATAFVGYRFYRRSVSPVIDLARKVERLELTSPSTADFQTTDLPVDVDSEIVTLTEALKRLIERTDDFITRERAFTRDASHELRSPLTVIRIASDLLLNEEKLDEAKRNTLLRIKRAAQDMEKLVEAFLLLARESGQGLPLEAIAVSDVLVAEVEKNRAMIDDKPIDLQLDVEQKIEVMAPRQVLAILFSNLIRNAMSYTDKGYVRVRTTNTRVIIEDTGIGMEGLESGELFKPFVRGDHKRRGGHGVGLTIVQKLSDRFGWPVKITSELDVGTRFEIDLAASIDVSMVKRDAS